MIRHLPLKTLYISLAGLLCAGTFLGAARGGPIPVETRCGWFSNPTPANVSLFDRDGEWIIGVQGGYQAKGDWPDFKDPHQWVETNGHYGYGCACLKLRVDKKNHRVIAIQSAKTRPLKACHQDPGLKKWKREYR